MRRKEGARLRAAGQRRRAWLGATGDRWALERRSVGPMVGSGEGMAGSGCSAAPPRTTSRLPRFPTYREPTNRCLEGLTHPSGINEESSSAHVYADRTRPRRHFSLGITFFGARRRASRRLST
ncbi:hypothetical protein BHE74_00033763 [Ensete ventricosum]|nr:hypothetical protein BHE74_00033763 [Ensete ventricosum]